MPNPLAKLNCLDHRSASASTAARRSSNRSARKANANAEPPLLSRSAETPVATEVYFRSVLLINRVNLKESEPLHNPILINNRGDTGYLLSLESHFIVYFRFG